MEGSMFIVRRSTHPQFKVDRENRQSMGMRGREGEGGCLISHRLPLAVRELSCCCGRIATYYTHTRCYMS